MINAHLFKAGMSILYSSHTFLNLVSIDVVTSVDTLNIPTSINFAYLEGL